MRIILLENIKNFGRMGDVKNVADGYARNFLFPRKMAKLATDVALKEVDSLKKKLASMEQVDKENVAKLAEQLKDIVLEFTKKASKTGKLFSSVNQEEIAETLSKKVGAQIGAESVNLEDHEGHIKQLGEHVIKIQLSPAQEGTPEVVAEVKIKVSQE